MADPEQDTPTRHPNSSRPAAPAADDPDATVIRDPSFWQRSRDPEATVIRGAPAAAPSAPGTPPLARRAPLALPAGFTLHEYRIERVLGQGGFGITYLAHDTHLDAPVAIKEYLPEEIAFRAGDASVSPNASRHRDRYRQGLENFVVEARTLATFRHRAIVRVARYFEAHRTAYMVLEYERGQPLRQWWPQHAALGEAGLVERLVPLLEGLETVHDAGYLHRDIKPDNIQVREQDSSFVLLDFGSALQTVALADQDAVVLTPGYAPLEQYGIGEQGPWTDIYAFGATLYWAVCGSKPPDAEQRAAGIQPQPAVDAGRGRFGEAFLRAIDWALQADATHRPRSIAAWRQALLADHLGSIALAEALQRDKGGREPPSPALAPRGSRLGVRLAAQAAGLLDPRRWPLAWKFSVAFIATALVPMLAVSSWNLADSLRALESAQLRKSELMAHGVADRLSQLMADLTHLGRVLAADADVGDWLAAPDEAVRERLRRKLQALDHADPDVSRITLIDAAGGVQASSTPASGATFGHPALLTAVQAGRPYVSPLSTDRTPSGHGLLLAQPLHDRQGTARGAVVVNVVASAVTEVLDAMRQGAQLTPFLIDADGIIVHHPDPDRLHRSLTPLSTAQQGAVAAERRFGRDHIASLGETDLARAMVGARHSGHVAYRSAASGVDEIAGFAPVQGQAWVVGLSESRAAFEAPLQALYQRLYGTLLLVGLLVAGLGLAMARSLVRPIRALTRGAKALEGGDFDGAKVAVHARDEVGQLARTFNVMVDVLQQRERDRRSR